jgi:FkbH-like protein
MISTFNSLRKKLKDDVSSFTKLKLAIVGDTSTQFLRTCIEGCAIENKFNLALFEADYNQIERVFLDKNSELFDFEPDYIVVFQSTQKFLSSYNKLDKNAKINFASERLNFIHHICSAVNSKVIYYNYPEIDDSVFGSYANLIQESFVFQVRKFNYELMLLTQELKNLFICDVQSLQNKFGRDALFSPSIYVNTDSVFSLEMLPYVASKTIDIVAAIEGRFKKCLILDLDNTLWGGIIGDDGIEHIQIGNNLGIGKAFSEFQEWILKLKNRGVILAVCSKNDEKIAKEPFESHPDMVLRLDDISVFVANWENKADNIRRIQSVLNIGFDSIVFLDDNPFERNIVRENIPEVCVPELPEDPAEYLEYLYSLNLFETNSYSEADLDRTLQYQTESKRMDMKLQFANEEDFLSSLSMVSEVSDFSKFNIPRVSQLSQRSNQYNLRTIRYTEQDVERISKDENYKTFTFTLKDKFGDNGLICVLILKISDAQTLFIDTWFMSCRVLKRGMECFVLNTIVDYAQQNNYSKIIGEYIETPKNKLVEHHYPNLDFTPVNYAGIECFQLFVNNYNKKECYILNKNIA